MSRALPAAAERFAQRLREWLGSRVQQVSVFGSYARGEATERSDLDVLVVVEGVTRPEKLVILDIATEVSLGQGLALHALVMSHEEHQRLYALEARLVEDIDAEGLPI